MDDFVLSNLQESRNEWCARLTGILTPLVIQGIRSIFEEAWSMCVTNNEVSKYLMTFQNLLCRVPKWNSVIVEEEIKRIIEKSGCNYLEDLITCVHIIQMKVLTSVRVGNRQKQIDISIPKLEHFIHKVYINVARKTYMNVYLFEKNINPLQIQKNNRELELIVQECILITIRDSIPTESIIRAYLDESVEQEEEVIIENVENPVLEGSEGEPNSKSEEGTGAKDSELPKNKEDDVPEVVPSIKNIDNEPVVSRLTFNDIDSVLEKDNSVKSVEAPKSIDHLERLSMERSIQQSLESDSDNESDNDDKIKIFDDPVTITDFDVLDLNSAGSAVSIEEPPLFEFEELH
jgi:hypothetical protein